jgi:acetyl esterase/lipase
MDKINRPIENDSNILKDIRSFLIKMNSENHKTNDEMSIEDTRDMLIKSSTSMSFDYSDIDVFNMDIQQDGISININIVKPKKAEEQLPVFMFFHGGGWAFEDFLTHKKLVRDLVVESGAVAVFPNYTLSPEVTYPIALNQVYAATKWISFHGDKIGVDGKKLAVVGNSAGGNLAAAVALMAKDKKGPNILYQILLWPVTDSDFSRESYKKYGQDRFLTTETMKWMWDNYVPDLIKRKEKYASPNQASIEELQGLPPALIQIAENDILYDEGIEYGRKLDEAGVATTITVYKGLIHDYGKLEHLSHIQSVRDSVTQVAIALKNILFK